MSQARDIPANRRIQRIKLEPFDDVISIKDRLQFVKAGRVLLVLPKRGNLLQRKLDIVLVQREATRRGLRLAIVTDDLTVAEFADELNISCFNSVEQARTTRWKRPRNKVFVDRNDRPDREYEYYDLQRRATRLKPELSKGRQRIQNTARGLIFGVSILAILFGLYGIIPTATITIKPAGDQLNAVIPLTADTEISSIDGLTVPAERRTFLQDTTVTISTSGLRNAENSLAEGVVTFENLTGVATFVPAGTIVETEGFSPIQFQTTEDVSLPARIGATRDSGVRALDSSSGVDGNLPANSIVDVVGVLAGSVSVINYNPTYGGGIRETSFVTQGDRERLLTLARQQIKQNAKDFLLINLDEGSSYLVDDSINILEERTLIYSAEVDAPVENISLSMQGFVEATVIDLNEARLAAFTNLGDYVAEGRLLSESTLTFRIGDVVQLQLDGRVSFEMRVEGSTQVGISEGDVKEVVTGQSESEAMTTLQENFDLDPRYTPQISIFPSFFNRMPIISSRIQVEIVQ